MKSFFLLLVSLILLSLSGCAPKYDYTVHKPKVLYKKPSRKALSRTLKEKLGTKYVWAEEGPRAFDCSGLTYYSYGRMNMPIPRVASEQAKVGTTVPLDALQYGDLIFFDTTKQRTGKITHVGIYIGEGKFQHAANEKEGVIITDLNSSYYRPRVVVCKRYLPTDQAPAAPYDGTMLAQSQPHNPPVTPLRIESHTIQATMPSTATPAPAEHGKHYIQVGSFTQEPSNGLFQQITSNGYHYTIQQASKKKKVLIGPYASHAEALKHLDEVRATILPDAFTVKI